MSFLTKLIPKFPTSIAEITNNPCEFLKTLLILAGILYLVYFLYNRFLAKGESYEELSEEAEDELEEIEDEDIDDDLTDLDDDEL